jgi:hypothetical protein
MPSAWAATIGRVCSNAPSVEDRPHPTLEPGVAAQQVLARDPAVLELQLGGVRRAAAELLELAHHVQAGRAAGQNEQRLPAMAELGVDGRVDDVHVRDAAVADPDLAAVDHPFVAVAAGAGAQVAHVAAALRLGDAECRELQVARLAEALGRPLEQLVGRRRLGHRRQRERGHDDREADPRAAPEQLLHEQRQRQPGRVADQVAVEERVLSPWLHLMPSSVGK